ncbi:MAG: hypothetical protein JW891_15950 [Candidatus Lokiarchaeota archaeon]|nr:hypothetical protein [Candidatus Lokiarchaeota archaeon]
MFYKEPIIIISLSIVLIAGYLLYCASNWLKRKKRNATSKEHLKQFYKDFIVLMVAFLLLVVPFFFML